MISQTYADWHRMQKALTEAQRHGGKAGRHAVAEALGINHRKCIQWVESVHSDSARHWRSKPGQGFHALTTQDAGGWHAALAFDGSADTSIHVYGHPTRESAVEHLERLLGRSTS